MITLLTSRIGIALCGLLGVLSAAGYAWAMHETAARRADEIATLQSEIDRARQFELAAKHRELALLQARRERDAALGLLRTLPDDGSLTARHDDRVSDLLNGRAVGVPDA